MIDYKELLESKEFRQITYQDLLFTTEWNSKRTLIVNRDFNRCSKCNLSATGDAVHFDDKTKTYSYFTDDGSEQLTDISKDGYIIEASVPNFIVTDKPYHLQVHHKYYIKNCLPWEYKDDALITLCNWCHSELHKNEIIEIYENEDFANAVNLTPCDRCNGVGWFQEYGYIEGGICFKCNGQRFTIPLFNIQ